MGAHLAAVTHTSGREGGRESAGLTPDHLGCQDDRCHGNPREEVQLGESNLFF